MKCELNEVDLYKLQNTLKPKQMIILKFTADWCAPCQGIKSLVDELVESLPDSIKFFEINVDESIELYAKFKSKKMVNGIPALLAWKPENLTFIPTFVVIGGNESEVQKFFDACKNSI